MDETKLTVEKAIKDGQRAWEEGIQRLGSQKRFLSSQFCRVVRQNGWEDGWMWQRHQRRIRNGKSCRAQPVSNKSLLEGTASTTVAFAPVSKKEARQPEMAIGVIEQPRLNQLLKHPLAIISYVPRELALFAAGAVAGAAAKTVTAPLDRIKLLMQAERCFSCSDPIHNKLSTPKFCKDSNLFSEWRLLAVIAVSNFYLGYCKITPSSCLSKDLQFMYL
jgi:hypothetical protein